MSLARVGARLMASSEAVMKMPPIFGRSVGRIDAERFHRIDRLQHALDLGPASTRSRISPPGRTKGSV